MEFLQLILGIFGLYSLLLFFLNNRENIFNMHIINMLKNRPPCYVPCYFSVISLLSLLLFACYLPVIFPVIFTRKYAAFHMKL